MLDKHTKRYLSEQFGYLGEEAHFSDIGNLINQASSYEDYVYLESAANSVEDDIAKKILKEQLLKKRMGWD